MVTSLLLKLMYPCVYASTLSDCLGTCDEGVEARIVTDLSERGIPVQTQKHTAKDVADAREKATENSNEARNDASKAAAETNAGLVAAAQANKKRDYNARVEMNEAEPEVQSANAKADFDVAMTDALGAHDIAGEKCDVLNSVDKDACLSTAAADLAAAEVKATATRDQSLAAADQRL